jgi:hypothetical protein
LPVLANSRLDWGAASLGALMTANGGGVIIGGILSGLGTRLARGRIGVMVLCIDSIVGLAIIALTLVHSTLAGASLLAVVGLLGGIAQISVFTWVQRRVSQDMMGRTMSVLLFTFMGLGPIAAAVSGALLKIISLSVLFGGAGLVLTVFALLCLTSPQMRGIGNTRPVPA